MEACTKVFVLFCFSKAQRSGNVQLDQIPSGKPWITLCVSVDSETSLVVGIHAGDARDMCQLLRKLQAVR